MKKNPMRYTISFYLSIILWRVNYECIYIYIFMQKLCIWICKNLRDMRKQAPFFLIIHKMFVKNLILHKNPRRKVEIEDYISSSIFCNIVSHKKKNLVFLFFIFFFFSCVTIARMTI